MPPILQARSLQRSDTDIRAFRGRHDFLRSVRWMARRLVPRSRSRSAGSTPSCVGSIRLRQSVSDFGGSLAGDRVAEAYPVVFVLQVKPVLDA